MISARASCTAFDGARRIARGALVDVALAVKAAQEKRTPGPLLVFDDATGEVVDLDLRGSAKDVAARLADWNEAPVSSPRKPRRGRPKLGVVAREVTSMRCLTIASRAGRSEIEAIIMMSTPMTAPIASPDRKSTRLNSSH